MTPTTRLPDFGPTSNGSRAASYRQEHSLISGVTVFDGRPYRIDGLAEALDLKGAQNTVGVHLEVLPVRGPVRLGHGCDDPVQLQNLVRGRGR